jgi:hypothetical protein
VSVIAGSAYHNDAAVEPPQTDPESGQP